MEWKAAAVFILLVIAGVILAGYVEGAFSSFLPSMSSSSSGA